MKVKKPKEKAKSENTGRDGGWNSNGVMADCGSVDTATLGRTLGIQPGNTVEAKQRRSMKKAVARTWMTMSQRQRCWVKLLPKEILGGISQH